MKKTILLALTLVLTASLMTGCRRRTADETSMPNNTGATETTAHTQPSTHETTHPSTQATTMPTMPEPTFDTNVPDSSDGSGATLPGNDDMARRRVRPVR